MAAPERVWDERMVAALPAGTFQRIKAVLANGEPRTAFVRAAIERELAEREAARAARRASSRQARA